MILRPEFQGSQHDDVLDSPGPLVKREGVMELKRETLRHDNDVNHICSKAIASTSSETTS